MKPQYLFLVLLLLFWKCSKDNNDQNNILQYTGVYPNIEYSESLIKEFEPGIYKESDIPEDIQNLSYGRIEIDFKYNGGGLTSFMPLFYYGSINKNNTDNAVEAPKFHLAIEIGHYKVIPVPVDYFFYTICTYNYPRYCRDSFSPVTAGQNYTFIMDKRPDGILIQLKQGDKIVNAFPHAYFPDSTQMFFKDVTSYTNANKGDSLQKVLMVGKGFTGIEPGMHTFNGEISGCRLYKYNGIENKSGYVLERMRNQHCESERIKYIARDNLSGTDKYIRLNYDFWPYKYESSCLVPYGEKQTVELDRVSNNKAAYWELDTNDIGFYKIYLQTLDKEGNIIHTTSKPFEIWVYPRQWEFEYY